MRCASGSVVVRARLALALALALVAGGCSSTAESADPVTCSQLDRDITAAVAMPGTCATAADCDTIGGQLSGTTTCNCAPFVLDCSGHPIENNAPGRTMAKMLIQRYVASGCAAMSSGCDCAPRGPMTCSPDHRCVAALQSCF
jgi:hypothetical protein